MSNKYILTLDASQIKHFDGFCNLAWAYRYRENLQLSDQKTAAMDSGTLIHLLLEYYYNSLATSKDLWFSQNDAVSKFRQEAPWKKSNTIFEDTYIEFLLKRFFQYVAYWEGRELKPFLVNNIPATELGFSKILYEDSETIFVVEGKIDLVNIIQENSEERILAITDHKSQEREAHYYNFRPQMLTYAWAARDLGVQYGIINYFGLQKAYIDKKTFRRDTMRIPSFMLERWEQYMMQVFLKIMKLDQAAPDIPSEIKYEKRLTSCAGAFETHPCVYTQLCECSSKEQIENIKNFKFHKIEKWQPWKIAEKTTEKQAEE
jgi:hypothetical protein